ncbi:hypothetical protein ACP4OV_025085 [Aristida adscensionis]
MAAEGSELGSPPPPPPPPKRRKIEPPRSGARGWLQVWASFSDSNGQNLIYLLVIGKFEICLLFSASELDRPQVALDKDKLAAPPNSLVSGAQPARVDLDKVREAKRFAVVLQAQHEGCLGSYKSFDSLYGNYLVPVIPDSDFFEQIPKK